MICKKEAQADKQIHDEMYSNVKKRDKGSVGQKMRGKQKQDASIGMSCYYGE